MDHWRGFSDEEIQRCALNVQSVNNHGKKSTDSQDSQLMKLKVSCEHEKVDPAIIIRKKVPNTENITRRSCNCPLTSDVQSKQCEFCIEEDNYDKYLCESNMLIANNEKLQQFPVVNIDCVKITPRNGISTVAELKNDELTFEKSKKSSTLEEFEKRQKQIEADNIRFKAIIAKTLVDRKKRTQEEVLKLEKIQRELKRLDLGLSDDVAILRKLIEQSSVEFHEAEKRYYRAEKEFVAAKVVLFNVMDKKEKLTEHLYKIIEQSENRKAHRLQELMQQLEVESFDREQQHKNIEEPKLLELNNIESSVCCSGEFPDSKKENPPTKTSS